MIWRYLPLHAYDLPMFDGAKLRELVKERANG